MSEALISIKVLAMKRGLVNEKTTTTQRLIKSLVVY